MSATIRKLPSELETVERAPTKRTETEPDEVLDRYRSATWSGARILEMPPRRWLASGWLPLDAVVALYGPPGCGKSYLALSLACEVARGGSWGGDRLDAAPVLYVAGERAADLRDRVEAWSVHHDTEVPERLHVLAPNGAPQLAQHTPREALVDLVRELGARIVVLDTLARMTLGQDENAARDMGAVVEGLDAIRQATSGGSVIVVHHSGKDRGRGMRGSTALLGAVDHAIELSPSDGGIRASVTKSNGGAPPSDAYYRLHPVQLDPLPGDDLQRSGAVVLEVGAPDARAASEGRIRDAIRDLLGDAYRDGATRRELEEGLRETGLEVRSSSLGKVLTRLAVGGEVEQLGRGRAVRWILRRTELGLE